MNTRLIIMLAVAAAVVAAVVLLLIPVGATSPGGRVLACGNGFSSADLAANTPASQAELAAEIAKARFDTRYTSLMEGYDAACSDAMAMRRGAGFGLAGVGVLGLAGALLVGPSRPVSLARRRSSAQ